MNAKELSLMMLLMKVARDQEYLKKVVNETGMDDLYEMAVKSGDIYAQGFQSLDMWHLMMFRPFKKNDDGTHVVKLMGLGLPKEAVPEEKAKEFFHALVEKMSEMEGIEFRALDEDAMQQDKEEILGKPKKKAPMAFDPKHLSSGRGQNLNNN